MVVLTKTCTICTTAIYTYLQNIICQIMTLDTKPYIYETLDHTHPVIFTASENGEYIPTKKYMELERNSLLTLSSNNPEIPLENHIVYMEIPLSLIILSITPNDRMIQTSNISCGVTHQI